ncbi:MAG: cupin domain-containing protein [SAR202 cluster bacterium]|nr:cupin domain-containing protein [SAR202 cluster bacterium]
MSYSLVGVGAGAPLHTHEADELIVILEGTVEARLGEETSRVGADHTLVIPPNTPHGFTSVGPGDARIVAFFPIPDPFAHTTFLEGKPPAPHRD